MNKSLFKVICLTSLITGAILGILPLFPIFTGISFIILMLFSAPFIIFYLHKLQFINDLNLQNCLFIGAVSGFFTMLGFSFVYLPLAFILNLIFNISSFLWIKVLFTNLGFLLPMIILFALMSALFNMFSAFLSLCIYDYFHAFKNK